MQCKPFFLLLLVLLPLLAYAAPTEDQEWEEFKGKHKKQYKDKIEEGKRRKIFKERAKEIAQHNDEFAKGKHSHSLKINQLADMTEDELQMLKGARVPFDAVLASEALPQPEVADRQIVASSVDLRRDRCMSPMKDQGYCGSCWAFSAAHLMEYAYCKKNNLASPVLLSEQNLVDCTYTRDGCQGGWYWTAWNRTNNMASAAVYPYVSGRTKTWNNNCNYTSAKQVTRVRSYNAITTVSAMEQALNIAPLAVALFANGTKFDYYSSGIYSDTVNCDATKISTYSNVTHAVTLVGYNNTNSPPYWILRNSWDTTWGMNGYMYIRKGINLCNIERWAYGNLTMV